MFARSAAFLVWALLAGLSVFWWLKLAARPLPVPAQAELALGLAAAPRADLSRVLGQAPAQPLAAAAPANDTRFKLLGVVAPKRAGAGHQHAGEGVAVIAIDGAPPRALRVGAVVAGDLRLLALDARSAELGRAGVASIRLELAAPPPASTGSLPALPSLVQPPPPPPATEAETSR